MQGAARPTGSQSTRELVCVCVCRCPEIPALRRAQQKMSAQLASTPIRTVRSKSVALLIWRRQGNVQPYTMIAHFPTGHHRSCIPLLYPIIAPEQQPFAVRCKICLRHIRLAKASYQRVIINAPQPYCEVFLAVGKEFASIGGEPCDQSTRFMFEFVYSMIMSDVPDCHTAPAVPK